jgi:hypothetical protein
MNRASHSERLRRKLELLLGPASAASSALLNHPRLAELIPEYLFMVHCSTRASVPLMEAARQRASKIASHDPVAAGLARYLESHIPEELHHDEWVLEDLESLGVPRDRVLERIPPPTIAAMVGSQYYWVLHYHPAALLGFLEVLEGYPVAAHELESIIARTHLPREAFRTLFEHSDLDRAHRDELHAAIDRLPLTPEQSALIGVSAFTTLHHATRFLEELVEFFAPADAASQLDSGRGAARRRAKSARTRATSAARAGSGAERRAR